MLKLHRTTIWTTTVLFCITCEANPTTTSTTLPTNSTILLPQHENVSNSSSSSSKTTTILSSKSMSSMTSSSSSSTEVIPELEVTTLPAENENQTKVDALEPSPSNENENKTIGLLSESNHTRPEHEMATTKQKPFNFTEELRKLPNQTIEFLLESPADETGNPGLEELPEVATGSESDNVTDEHILQEPLAGEELANLTSDLPSKALQEFKNLTEEFWLWQLQEFPQFASSVGIYGETAKRLDTLTLESVEQRKIVCEDFLQRALMINATLLPENEELSLQIFIDDVSFFLQNAKYYK
ncbi:hypothetical protein SK128_012147 [Halocaridina rubra]|uniref:Uncharacterized protein n=1 Tax=Halocaridina rubra TaxID=373956 RepID=A0AAN8X1B8_HALRR